MRAPIFERSLTSYVTTRHPIPVSAASAAAVSKAYEPEHVYRTVFTALSGEMYASFCQKFTSRIAGHSDFVQANDDTGMGIIKAMVSATATRKLYLLAMNFIWGLGADITATTEERAQGIAQCLIPLCMEAKETSEHFIFPDLKLIDFSTDEYSALAQHVRAMLMDLCEGKIERFSPANEIMRKILLPKLKITEIEHFQFYQRLVQLKKNHDQLNTSSFKVPKLEISKMHELFPDLAIPGFKTFLQVAEEMLIFNEAYVGRPHPDDIKAIVHALIKAFPDVIAISVSLSAEICLEAARVELKSRRVVTKEIFLLLRVFTLDLTATGSGNGSGASPQQAGARRVRTLSSELPSLMSSGRSLSAGMLVLRRGIFSKRPGAVPEDKVCMALLGSAATIKQAFLSIDDSALEFWAQATEIQRASLVLIGLSYAGEVVTDVATKGSCVLFAGLWAAVLGKLGLTECFSLALQQLCSAEELVRSQSRIAALLKTFMKVLGAVKTPMATGERDQLLFRLDVARYCMELILKENVGDAKIIALILEEMDTLQESSECYVPFFTLILEVISKLASSHIDIVFSFFASGDLVKLLAQMRRLSFLDRKDQVPGHALEQPFKAALSAIVSHENIVLAKIMQQQLPLRTLLVFFDLNELLSQLLNVKEGSLDAVVTAHLENKVTRLKGLKVPSTSSDEDVFFDCLYRCIEREKTLFEALTEGEPKLVQAFAKARPQAWSRIEEAHAAEKEKVKQMYGSLAQ